MTTRSQAVKNATHELMDHIETVCLIKNGAQPKLEKLIFNLMTACIGLAPVNSMNSGTKNEIDTEIMALREAAQMAYDWMTEHGAVVFSGGGMTAVDQMNTTAIALRKSLGTNQIVHP